MLLNPSKNRFVLLLLVLLLPLLAPLVDASIPFREPAAAVTYWRCCLLCRIEFDGLVLPLLPLLATAAKRRTVVLVLASWAAARTQSRLVLLVSDAILLVHFFYC